MFTQEDYINEFNLFPLKNIQCKGGSGGGGSSGKVDFPAHMKTAHKDWLDSTGVDTMTFSVVDLMNTAMTGVSPYNGYVPVDPDDIFVAVAKTPANYKSPYVFLEGFDAWDIDSAFDSYIVDDEARISATVSAHSDLLDDEINTRVLPAFKAGMANINATMSSAFVIGEATIRDSKVKKVAETDANIRLKRLQEGADVAMKRISAIHEWRRITATLSTELTRLYLAAQFERDENYLDKLDKDAKWDLEMYQYGSQVMASISGTASTTSTTPKASVLGGAVSGALAGAAMGAQIGAAGGPIGAGGGALLGLAASFL